VGRGRLIFVTYADGTYERNYRWNSFFAKYFMGADNCLFFSRSDLVKTTIYREHRAVFDAERGKGYWAWKPYCILEAMKTANPGDVVVYQDCGRGWRYKSFLRPSRLLDEARRVDFIAGVSSPQYGPNRKWNHRTCLQAMGDGSSQYEDTPTIEAVVSFWTLCDASIAFVSEWLSFCLQFDVIRDPTIEEAKQQHPEFVEHRYDQAILTNLVIRRNAPVLKPKQNLSRLGKSITMLEMDLRSRNNGIYRVLVWFILKLRA